VYVILVYDVGEDRVGRVCRYLRRYLPRVQNSVFEGELTEAKLAVMKAGLSKHLDEQVDSVLLWVMRDTRWTDRQTMGREKLPVSNFF
jgi:CRISPR-associated protein Cas2